MKTYALSSCLLLMVMLSSFTVEKSMPKIGRKEAHETWLQTVGSYALTGEWKQLGHIAKAAIDDEVSINDLLDLAQEIQVAPFLRALVATQNIRALSSDTGIAKSELFRIALFIETELDKAIELYGTNYLSRRKTGLERTLEYHPETKRLFIHLKDHGIDEVGRGVKKVVTKSILYDVENPEFVARCSSSSNMYEEMTALQYMQGSKGIVKLYGCSQRPAQDGSTVYSMFCKLYEGGTLSKAFKEKRKFSYKQKLSIARDLLEGLAALHSKGLVHRDLTTRNILLDVDNSGKRVRYDAVIGDFGRIKHIESAHGIKVQFNSRYLAPEGIIAERLSGEDYYATDLFALGCILHRLLFEKNGPWIDKVNLKNPTQPDVVKEAKFIHDLKQYREVRLSKIILDRGFGADVTLEDHFEHLVLQLVHAEPSKRGTAQQLAKVMNDLVDEYEQRAVKANSVPVPVVEDPSVSVQQQSSETTFISNPDF